jgi:phosphoenolpyruvate phosphomutase
LFVIARTEALIAGHTMAEALDRGNAFADAGADAVLIHSKSKSPEQVLEFASRWKRETPLVAVPTTYNTITAAELGRHGFRLVIFANHGLRSAIKGMQQAFTKLLAAGRACVLDDDVVSLKAVFDLVGLDALEASERKYLPPAEPAHDAV